MRWSSRPRFRTPWTGLPGAEDDGVMGDHDQDDVAGPARSPLSAAQARERTALSGSKSQNSRT
ncbi:hypothetical protein AB0H94_35065 [Streptomyces purpurascens]|uniref:hypothetical protein n=1 Tax=Streptomyces purpurascens TaxID=1924 RepID=UPI0033C0DCCF